MSEQVDRSQGTRAKPALENAEAEDTGGFGDFNRAYAALADAAFLTKFGAANELLGMLPFSRWAGHVVTLSDEGGGRSFAADSALADAANGKAAEAVVDEWAALISRNTVRCRDTVLIRGVSVSAPLKVGALRIASFDTLPADHPLRGRQRPEQLSYIQSPEDWPHLRRSEVLLQSDYEISPAAYPGKLPDPFPAEPSQERLKTLVDTVRAIALATEGAVSAPVRYGEVTEPLMATWHKSWRPFFRDAPINQDCQPDWVLADALARCLSTLTGLETVRLAIDMFYAARLEPDLRLAVIMLGTALEIATLDNAQAELSMRMALHTAWLLGRNRSERQAVFARVKRLTDARNKAVHRGLLPDGFDRGDAERVVQQVLTALVLDGKVPKWQELVLGEGP